MKQNVLNPSGYFIHQRIGYHSTPFGCITTKYYRYRRVIKGYRRLFDPAIPFYNPYLSVLLWQETNDIFEDNPPVWLTFIATNTAGNKK